LIKILIYFKQKWAQSTAGKNEAKNKETGMPLSRKMTPFVVDNLSLSGIAHAHNKTLRKELLDFRNKRDKFLKKRYHLLSPFLPEKVCFSQI
jgi:hypothetical protein